MVGVWRWWGCGGGGGGALLAAFRAACAFVRRGGRCPCCAGRRRGLVQFMDKVVLPVVVQHRSFGPDSAARGVPQLQFLDKVVTCPLLRRQVHEGFEEQKTVEVPLLQFVEFFDQVVDIPVVAQMQIPMVLF